jgi:hypothetical protein
MKEIELSRNKHRYTIGNQSYKAGKSSATGFTMLNYGILNYETRRGVDAVLGN